MAVMHRKIKPLHKAAGAGQLPTAIKNFLRTITCLKVYLTYICPVEQIKLQIRDQIQRLTKRPKIGFSFDLPNNLRLFSFGFLGFTGSTYRRPCFFFNYSSMKFVI